MTDGMDKVREALLLHGVSEQITDEVRARLEALFARYEGKRTTPQRLDRLRREVKLILADAIRRGAGPH